MGELVRVAFAGRKAGANSEYKNYRVTAPGRPAFEPDWSSMVDRDDDEEEF